MTPELTRAGYTVSAIGRSQKKAMLARLGATAVDVSLFEPARLRAAIDGNEAVMNLAPHLPRGKVTFLQWAWCENDRVRREGSAKYSSVARRAPNAYRFWGVGTASSQ